MLIHTLLDDSPYNRLDINQKDSKYTVWLVDSLGENLEKFRLANLLFHLPIELAFTTDVLRRCGS